MKRWKVREGKSYAKGLGYCKVQSPPPPPPAELLYREVPHGVIEVLENAPEVWKGWAQRTLEAIRSRTLHTLGHSDRGEWEVFARFVAYRLPEELGRAWLRAVRIPYDPEAPPF